MTPIRLECNISKTAAGDRDSVPKDHCRK